MSTKPDLRTAAQAVIDRWETPLWKDAPATAGYIAALRDALAADHTEHHLEMVGRWYMVTQDGAATLCVDREDAEAEARKADREWPRNGPHRAVQLVEASFEAAARLEIESLRKEHADELAVAYMCGASREKEIAAQPSYEHQRAIMEGERNASLDAYSRVVSITSAESRIYERAFTSGWDRRDRLASHGQAPAQAAPAAVTGPDEIDHLRAALVYVAFALHNTRQYMLAEGVTLIGGDTVRVSRDGWTVEASSNPLRQHIPQPSPAAQVDALDAARWRALLACGRIRIIGTAGVTGTGAHDPKALDPNKQPYGNYVHFGAEFWSTFPDQDYYNTKENPAYARATLTEFADAARAAQEGK